MDLARRPPTLSVPAPAASGAFAGVPPRAEPSVRVPRSRQRSRRKIMTLAISATCLLFVVGMFGWFIIQAGMFEEVAKPVTAAKSAKGAPLPSVKESILFGPVFTGFDKQKQPYSVSAKQAKRDEDNPEVVHLDEVKGELKLRGSGDLILMTAANGVYSSETKKLDLTGDVRMISTGKYSAKTKAAKVNMTEKHLRSDNPVVVVFSAGTVKSNGVELWDAGERILFFNGVKLHIPPQAKEGSE
ncbi:MAG: LPS export ABC transporter periplasmic protein LptC [Pseudomonadota bacterium]